MKQWVQKLVQQLDSKETSGDTSCAALPTTVSDDRATLLYILDIYSKHLVELAGYPVRVVRETLDHLCKELITSDESKHEKVLFRLRQFFSTYRVSEYTYVRTTFDEFKGIVWDMVDQLAEDFPEENASADEPGQINQVKDAVEADSIDDLKDKAREFIDSYVEFQAKREARRARRTAGIQKNLNIVKQQLVDAHKDVQEDHLTGAFNRRSFDDQIQQQSDRFAISQTPTSLITLDIDFFKKVNDSYGHDTGDFVIKECVRLVKESFTRENDFVARIGGEEFAVILPDCPIEQATRMAEACLARIRKEVVMHGELQLRFTISMGIAQLHAGESSTQWLKRADDALYASKHGGRDRYTVAPSIVAINEVA